MTKIICNPNCENSPKMELIKQFNIAFAQGNVELLSESVTDEIVWNIIGQKIIEGKEYFVDELKKMEEEKVDELTLKQILSHGKEGAANGVIKMQNGKEYAFSDVYLFDSAKGAKIKTITSYVIAI